MHTVSFRFFPLSSTVSPLNSSSVSIVDGFRATTELSSFVASSTSSLLGDFLRSRMAVEKSFFLSAPFSPAFAFASLSSGGGDCR